MPRDRLTEGALLLGPVLRPYGFEFILRAEGRDLGGEFAEGEFMRGARSLALRVRRSISLANYQIGPAFVTHRGYLDALGVRECSAHAECSEDPLAGFLRLAVDIARYAEDFLNGNGTIVIRAAARERAHHEATYRCFLTGFVDDVLIRARAHREFGAREWDTVVRLLESLRYPDQMESTEHHHFEFSRRHCGEHRRVAATERWEQVVRATLAASSAQKGACALVDITAAVGYGKGTPRAPEIRCERNLACDEALDQHSRDCFAECRAREFSSGSAFPWIAGTSESDLGVAIYLDAMNRPRFDPNDAA